MKRYNKTIKKLLSYSAMFLLLLQLIIPSAKIGISIADRDAYASVCLGDDPTDDTRN